VVSKDMAGMPGNPQITFGVQLDRLFAVLKEVTHTDDLAAMANVNHGSPMSGYKAMLKVLDQAMRAMVSPKALGFLAFYVDVVLKGAMYVVREKQVYTKAIPANMLQTNLGTIARCVAGEASWRRAPRTRARTRHSRMRAPPQHRAVGVGQDVLRAGAQEGQHGHHRGRRGEGPDEGGVHDR